MEEILKYTGIGGLALSVLFVLFKNIIKKNIFPSLSQVQGYKILRLIIILVFVISLVSIIIYFLLDYKTKSNTQTHNGSDTASSTRKLEITGNNNTTIQGNNNQITNVSNEPLTYNNYTEDKEPDTLGAFLNKNMGKEVFLNLYFSNPKWDDDPDTVNQNYTKHSYQITEFENKPFDENSNYGNITKIEFRSLLPTNITYVDDFGQRKHLYYRQHQNEEDPIIVRINEKNREFVTWEKWSAYVKGKYIINYIIGGQGHNFIELIPMN